MMETFIDRALAGDADWWCVRQLLLDSYPITGPLFNWEMRHWDGERYHNASSVLRPEWTERVHLWETRQGRLVGVVNPDGEGEACLQLHPDYRELEEEIVGWAEEHLRVAVEGGRRQLDLFVWEYDSPRKRLLAARAYMKTERSGVVRRLFPGERPVPRRILPAGYTLRGTRPDDWQDCAGIAALLNAAFNRTFHRAEELWTFSHESPSFRHDLNLVAEAPDGSIAAHVGINWDSQNCRAIYEPVCAHPAHRQEGLAQALMWEGLRRARDLGARVVYVETGSAVAANALYESVGFTETYMGYTWRKTW